MFTRQRRNYRIFVYAALITTLCVLVAALMWPKEPESAENGHIKAGTEANADSRGDGEGSVGDKKEHVDSDGKNDDKDGDGLGNGEDFVNGDKPVVSDGKDTYYVVRRNGDRISVFFSAENGEEIELETTDILYELLTPEDQKIFDEGIKAESQEELSSILQDFEG